MSKYPTHEVFNQSIPFEGFNLFTHDTVLLEALEREGGFWAKADLEKLGALFANSEVIDWGFKANEYLPVLKTFNKFGQRIDEVEYHPAYHQLMKTSVEWGLHSSAWEEGKEAAQVVRSVAYFMGAQNESGHVCPITMTYAVVPVLKKNLDIGLLWLDKILTRSYDPRFVPASQKSGVIFGMAMTEKQGGSDVRANTTKAEIISSSQNEYLLTGHKWFCSAPMSDAFLVLAQAQKGLTCFLVPRFKPDGSKNNFYIQRLKNKLGNKSNASSEIEFLDTWAQRVGEEGRGVPTIIEMVNHTRFDCVLGSSALMRRALVEAIHHARHREVFGKKLIDQPLMKNVLSDLALESEASTVLSMRLARAFDSQEESEKIFRRLATAVSKYWVCKRAPYFTYEAMECLGGAGYVEESILPRLFREAPVNSIWEGSGNVNALDTLRAMAKEPESPLVFLQEIEALKGENVYLDQSIVDLKKMFSSKNIQEGEARWMIQKMVLALQASLLLKYSPPYVAQAFCESRLQGNFGAQFGVLNSQVSFNLILERAYKN